MVDRTFAVRNTTRGTVLAARAHGGGSFWESLRGLMFRERLGEGEALWLPGVNNIHMFFMRFPIDAVFVGAGERGDAGARTVVAVRPGLRPWRDVVWWVRGGHGVLELPAGAAAAGGTQVGDVLEFADVQSP
jgi:uncharacterized membrane protein (UPF0127 family)